MITSSVFSQKQLTAVLSIITFFFFMYGMDANTVLAQDTEIPPEVFAAIENALPREADLPGGYAWELEKLETETYRNDHFYHYYIQWDSDRSQDPWLIVYCDIRAYEPKWGLPPGHDSPYFEHNMPNYQSWADLPGAYRLVQDTTDRQNCDIVFWNKDGSISTSLYIGGTTDNPCPETERLAKLVYSRLPEKFYSLKSGQDFTVPGFNQTVTSPDFTADPSGNDTASPSISGDPPGPALTGPGSDSPISDAALPLAVGAATLVTILSTLGLIFSDGTTPADAFGELKAFLTPNREEAQSLPQTLPADGCDPQEILSDPRLHDQVTDVNGKQWVYYRRPGDEAGDGWTSLEAYNQTKAMEKENKIWADRYGWQTKAELYNSEQMAEKFAADNRQATVKFNEELKAQPTPPPAELPSAELPSYISGQERERFAAAVKEATQQFEQETDDILKELVASERRHKESVERSDKLGREIELEGKKASFVLKLAEDTQKLRKEGYWIRNPNNSKTIDKLNLLHSPLDPRGLRCEDAVNLRYEEVRKKAVELFGEGVIVDKVVVVERSTYAPEGWIDQLDSRLDYNHNAIRVITPDGEAFIADDWQALHSKGSTKGLMQPEEKFVKNWKGKLGENDYHHYSYRDGSELLHGHDTKVKEYIDEYGVEEGLRLWQADTSRKIEANIKIPDPDKDAYAKRMETIINYMKKNTDKIGM